MDHECVVWKADPPVSSDGIEAAIRVGLTACAVTQKGAPSLDQATLTVWVGDLEGEGTAEQIATAFKAWRKGNPFFPTPNDIIELVRHSRRRPFVAIADDTQPLPKRCPTDEQRAAAKRRIAEREAEIAAKMRLGR